MESDRGRGSESVAVVDIDGEERLGGLNIRIKNQVSRINKHPKVPRLVELEIAWNLKLG